ncbi:MAG: virulence factor [Roseovarius sp.]
MTRISVLCWQEIPSVVEARDGGKSHKIELSRRFQELIDLIAMKRGLGGTDEYLMHWNKQAQPETDERPEDAAARVAAEIEARYDSIRSDALAAS